jgi:hypothetical protein
MPIDEGYINPQHDIDALNHVFTYQSPNPEQISKMQEIRAMALSLGHLLLKHCPRSADRSAAIRKLRECVMTANAAIVLDGRGAG